MAKREWIAGVWEQYREDNGGDGLSIRSRHSTESLARAAAKRFAREQQRFGAQTGGRLSWAGGFRHVDAAMVAWVDGAGNPV